MTPHSIIKEHAAKMMKFNAEIPTSKSVNKLLCIVEVMAQTLEDIVRQLSCSACDLSLNAGLSGMIAETTLEQVAATLTWVGQDE